jgi:hypothetical protein
MFMPCICGMLETQDLVAASPLLQQVRAGG